MYQIFFHYSKEALLITSVIVLLVGLFVLLYFLKVRADKIAKSFEKVEEKSSENIKSTKTYAVSEEKEDFSSYYEKVLNSEEHKVKGRFDY